MDYEACAPQTSGRVYSTDIRVAKIDVAVVDPPAGGFLAAVRWHIS